MGGFEPKQDKRAMHGGTRHTTRNAGRPGSVLTHAIHRPHNPDEKVHEGWFPSTDGNIYQYPPGIESEHQRGRYRYQVRTALAREELRIAGQHRGHEPIVQRSTKDGPEPPSAKPVPDTPSGTSYAESGPGYTVATDGSGLVRIRVPDTLTEWEVVVEAYREVFRISPAEAQYGAAVEGASITGFTHEGKQPAGEGMVWHRLRFPPHMMERVADDLTPDDLHAQAVDVSMEAYLQFRDWLAQHEPTGDKPSIERDFGLWVRENQGKFTGKLERLNMGQAITVPGNNPLYASLLHDVVEMVTWDRARLARTTMAAADREEREERRRLGDTGETILDGLRRLETAALFTLQEARAAKDFGSSIPAALLPRYEAIRRAVMPLEPAMEAGQPGDLLGPGLTAAIQSFITDLHQRSEKYGASSHHGPTTRPAAREYGPLNRFILANLLEKGETRTPDDNRLLLAELYRAFLGMFQLVGHAEGKASPDQAAALEAVGRTGQRLAGIAADHPGAVTVRARFVPQEALDGMDISGPPDKAPGIDLRLYTWHDPSTMEWVLEDYTDFVKATAGSRKQNRAPGLPDGTLPAELFATLDSEHRYPRGALIYQVPGEGTWRIQRNESPMTWESWAKGAGMALMVAAMAVPTAGTSLVLTALVAATAATVSELVTKRRATGNLTFKDYTVGVADLAGTIAGAGMAAFRLAGKAGTAVYRMLQVAEIAGDSVALAFYTADAYNSITQYAKLNPGDAWGLTRMLLFNIAMGSVQAIGIRGGIGDIRQHGVDLNAPKDKNGTKERRENVGLEGGKKISHKIAVQNSIGEHYPQIEVEGYGIIPFPKGPYTPNNSKTFRKDFTVKLKLEFKEWWIGQGRPWPKIPEGKQLNIHHIKPLSHGGDNSFENLVPLVNPDQHLPFTNWWKNFDSNLLP